MTPRRNILKLKNFRKNHEQRIAALEQSKSGDIYSEDETIVGTWINGKDIYRKVIIKSFSPANVNHEINLAGDIPSAEFILPNFQIFEGSNSIKGHSFIDNGQNIGFYLNNLSVFKHKTNEISFVNFKHNTAIFIILEYTKTSK